MDNYILIERHGHAGGTCRQPEIVQYLEHCADKYGVRRRKKLWQVTTKSNDEEKQIFTRVAVAATRPLSSAAYPKDIPGIDTCEAVVGTGASAIQVVPEIQQMNVSQLLVFQRTLLWIVPRVDRTITQWEKNLLARFPIVKKFIRRSLYWSREALVLSFVYRWSLRFINQALVISNLEREIKDVELRRKVTATWDFECKRALISSDWYPTLQKPNTHPVDIIVRATGFEAQQFALPIYGIDGCALAEQWSDTMKAYRAMTEPNFPNLFVLLGPKSRLGHSSVTIMLEAQLKYITEALLYTFENSLGSIEIKDGGRHSWSRNVDGVVTTIRHDFTWIYHENCTLEK
ncbi:unnamed protein product [Rotaria socialis]|uniref:Uncharacterized protein n=3 Tax=Rotaria socialis TaxID=392032 RepID=A0A820AMB9_9BILA|nr:unnamed protein product [Rotaria socialis]CAF4834652.1 unnamed protein product [Rotaria socialis]